MKLKAIASTPTKLYGRNSGKNCSPTKINARLSVIEPDLNEDPIDCWRTNGVDLVLSPSTSFLFLFLKPQNPDIQNHNSNPDFLIFSRNQHRINLNQTQTQQQI